MINKVKHIDLQYFGDIELFSALIKQTNVFYLPDVRYKKSLHLNRTCLIGANGPLLLAVPLLGGRDHRQLAKDVQITYSDPWQKIQWKSIQSAYRKAPWFDEYAPDLEILFQLREKFLLDLNLKTMEWAIKKLKFKLDILADTELKSYIRAVEKSLSNADKCEPVFPPYQQVFSDRHGFVPNLSILDLLFCEGPSAKIYLEQIQYS